MPLGIVPFPFGKCRICQDKATGLHYGVATCEGCKGFFKRSTLRGNKYTCYFGGSCEITPKNRNRCKSCRYKRCTDVGMALDAVRMGRIPKVEKEKVLEVFQKCGSDYNKLELSVQQTEKGSYNFNLNPALPVAMETNSPEEDGSSCVTDDRARDNKELCHTAAGSDDSNENECIQGGPTVTDIPNRKSSFQDSSKTSSPTHKSSFQDSPKTSSSDNRTSLEGSPKTGISNKEEVKLSKTESVSYGIPIKKDADFIESYDDCFSTTIMPQSHHTSEHTMQNKHTSDHTIQRKHTSDHTMQSKHTTNGQTMQNKHTSQNWQRLQQSPHTLKRQKTVQNHDIPQRQHSSPNVVTPHCQFTTPHRRHSQSEHAVNWDQSNWYPHTQGHIQQFNQQAENQAGYNPTNIVRHGLQTSTNYPLHTQHSNKDITPFRTFHQDLSAHSNLNVLNGRSSSSWQMYERAWDMTNMPSGEHLLRMNVNESGLNQTCNQRKATTHSGNVNTEKDILDWQQQFGDGQWNSDKCPSFSSLKIDTSGTSTFAQKKMDHAIHQSSDMVNVQGSWHPNLAQTQTTCKPSYGHLSSEKQTCPTSQTLYHTSTSNIDPLTDRTFHSAHMYHEKQQEDSSFTEHLSIKSFNDNLAKSSYRADADQQTQSNIDKNIVTSESTSQGKVGDSQVKSILDETVKTLADKSATSYVTSVDLRGKSKQDEKGMDEEKLHDVLYELTQHDVLEPSGSNVSTYDTFVKEGSNSPLSDVSDVSFKNCPSTISSRSSSSSRFNSSIMRIFSNVMMEAPARERLTDRLKQILSLKDKTYVESVVNLIQNELQNTLSQMGEKQKSQEDCKRTEERRHDSSELIESKKRTLKRFLDDIKSFPNEIKFADGEGGNDLTISSTNNTLGNDKDGILGLCQNKEISNSEGFLTENQDEMETSLTSLNLAMRILYRLKPEHREKIKLFQMGKINVRVMTNSDEDMEFVYDRIMTSIPMMNERVFGFCEHVPNFNTINKEDRSKLIKRSYYDIWMLTYSEYFKDGNCYIILSTGEIYSIEAMRKILNDTIVDTMVSFAEQFNALHLTDLEVSTLCAIQLTKPDSIGIEDRQTVRQLHSHLLSVFVYELERSHPSDYSQLITRVYQLLPLLEEINLLQKTIIAPLPTKFKKKE